MPNFRTIWCPFCPADQQPDCNTNSSLKDHLEAAHLGHFLVDPVPDFATVNDAHHIPYNPMDFMHCKCGKLYTSQGLANHQNHCRCLLFGHRRRKHSTCPCANCIDPAYAQEATICGVQCRSPQYQNLAPLQASLVQKLNNLTFLSEVDELTPP